MSYQPADPLERFGAPYTPEALSDVRPWLQHTAQFLVARSDAITPGAQQVAARFAKWLTVSLHEETSRTMGGRLLLAISFRLLVDGTVPGRGATREILFSLAPPEEFIRVRVRTDDSAPWRTVAALDLGELTTYQVHAIFADLAMRLITRKNRRPSLRDPRQRLIEAIARVIEISAPKKLQHADELALWALHCYEQGHFLVDSAGRRLPLSPDQIVNGAVLVSRQRRGESRDAR